MNIFTIRLNKYELKMAYISKIFFVLVITVSFSSASFAQNSQSSQSNFKTEKDSLISLKQYLTEENNKLNSDVDSLKALSASLDKKMDLANSELHNYKSKLFVRKYGRDEGDKVLNGQIWKGMTEEMVKDSWGKPDKTHKDVYKWGTFEQWYYGDVTYFFKNGKLTDWEEKKKDK